MRLSLEKMRAVASQVNERKRDLEQAQLLLQVQQSVPADSKVRTPDARCWPAR